MPISPLDATLRGISTLQARQDAVSSFKIWATMSDHIEVAVIPCAGLGTRFLPVTRSVPKPLLPVNHTPLIQYAVKEAADAGIKEVVLILSPGTETVATYFHRQPTLEEALEARGKQAELTQQLDIAAMADVRYVFQEEALGLGHAVLCGREHVRGRPFAVILPDDLIWATQPAIGQLADVWTQHSGSVIAAKRVPDYAVPALGIIGGNELSNRVWQVNTLVEKPKLEEAPSNLAIIGRYVLDPGVFPHLEKGQRGAGGEIQLTDGIAATIGHRPVHACVFKGAHIDAGTPPGMLAAAMFEAKRDGALHKRAQEMLVSAESTEQGE